MSEMKVPDIPGVELRPIPGIVGYAAGSDGFIYSFRRRRGKTSTTPLYTTNPRRLSGWCYKPDSGRRRVTLRWRGKRDYSVHGLVASAFHGPCPPGLECSHLNGDATDNRPPNLRWETHVENELRKRDHGTAPSGERGTGAKLEWEQVHEIRYRRGVLGESLKALASEFGVCRQTISKIALGETWKDQDIAAAERELEQEKKA